MDYDAALQAALDPVGREDLAVIEAALDALRTHRATKQSEQDRIAADLKALLKIITDLSRQAESKRLNFINPGQIQGGGNEGPSTFHNFPRIPNEVKVMIWEYAVQSRFIIGGSYSPDGRGFQKHNRLIASPYTPPLLHVDRNAREYGLKIYTLADASDYVQAKKIYVSYDLDIFILAKYFGKFYPLAPQHLPRSIMANVRHLAISHETFDMIVEDGSFTFKWPRLNPGEAASVEVYQPPRTGHEGQWPLHRFQNHGTQIDMTGFSRNDGARRGAYSFNPGIFWYLADFNSKNWFDPFSRCHSLQTVSVIDTGLDGRLIELSQNLPDLLPKFKMRNILAAMTFNIKDDKENQWNALIAKKEINHPNWNRFNINLVEMELDWTGISEYGEHFGLHRDNSKAARFRAPE